METGTVEELVEAIARIAPSYGGINLEDISAPRCFDIEEQLKERLDIPVFHDDQHGTAIVVLAGLLNAAKVLGRQVPDLRGRRLRRRRGRGRRDPAAAAGRGARRRRLRLARHHLAGPPGPHRAQEPAGGLDQPARPCTGRLGAALEGADVFVGRLGRHRCRRRRSPRWPRAASCSRSPTRRPRCTPTSPAGTPPWWPPVARTSRTRSTTCSPSPASSAARWTPGATQITEAMKLAAAHAIADLVEEPTVDCIVPSVFQEGVAEAVAAAVRALAPERRPPGPHRARVT